MCVVRTADGRSYGHVITKISRKDGLPNFLRYGALLARVSARSRAPNVRSWGFPRSAKMPAWLWPHCGNHLHTCRSFEAIRTGHFTLWWVWRPKIEIRIATSAFVIDERWYVVFTGNHVNVQEFIAWDRPHLSKLRMVIRSKNPETAICHVR